MLIRQFNLQIITHDKNTLLALCADRECSIVGFWKPQLPRIESDHMITITSVSVR